VADPSEEALAAAFQRAAFEASPLAICVFDLTDLALLSFNESTVARYGYSREELAGMRLAELHDPAEVPSLVGELQALEASDPDASHRTRTYRHRTKSGLTHDVELTLCRVQQGARRLAVALIEDVTEQRFAEGALWEAEHRLQAVVDSAPIVLWAVDREGVYTLSVGRGLRALGLRPGEVVGRSLFEMYRDVPAILDAVRRALRGETFSQLVSVGKLHFDSWYSPLRGRDGEIEGVIGSATDVTERVRAESQRRAGEERFRSLVENSSDWVILIGSEGRVQYSSPAVTHMLGYAVDEYVGRNAFDLVHPDDEERARALFGASLAAPGSRVTAEVRYRHKDGSWRTIEAVGVNRLKDPAVAAIVVNVRDVSERRRAEALQSALYRIAEVAAAPGDLPTLLGRVHAIVGELMPARNLYVALHDPQTGLLSFPYYVDEIDAPPAPHPLGKGLTEYVLRTGRPYLVSHETFLELADRGEVELVGANSLDWLGVPLRIEGRTFGVLAVQSYAREVRHGERDREVLTFVSHEIAQAISRAQAYQALRESEARKTAAVEAALDGIVGMDERGHVTEFNGAAERIFGRRREEVMGKELAGLLIPPELRERHRRGLARFLASGEGPVVGRRMEVGALHADGRLLPVELAITAIRVPGQPPSFTAFVRDLAAPPPRDAAGHDTLSLVAHELRAPLTAIQGSLQVLATSTLAPRDRKLLQLAARGVERMTRLSEDLLDLQSAGANRLLLSSERLEVAPLLLESAEFARAQAAAQGVSLDTDGLPPGLVVEGDRERLLQVLANLLTNAIRVSPSGASVRLACRRAGTRVRIEVSDRGPGVPEEFRGRIFQRFARAQDGHPGYKGTGLGLAISKQIVESHQGRIGFEPAPEGGATFFFELPASAAPDNSPEGPAPGARG
jgi:PAS domain S-box-containing protein